MSDCKHLLSQPYVVSLVCMQNFEAIDSTSIQKISGQAVKKEAALGIPSSNVGYRLLKKAGWREGSGIGAQEQGRQQPLEPELVRGSAGLGYERKVERRKRQQPAADNRPKAMKVERGQRVLAAKAEENAGKAIARYIYSVFNETTGEPTLDDNPLLRNSKLTATNPLLKK